MVDTQDTRTENDVSIKTVLVMGSSFVGFRECHTRTSRKERDNE